MDKILTLIILVGSLGVVHRLAAVDWRFFIFFRLKSIISSCINRNTDLETKFMEDILLIWRFKRGSVEALRRIYDKYESDMLAVAVNLIRDVHTANDIVHDVMVSFSESRDKLKLNGSLKSFLLTCVINGVRDELRMKRRTYAVINEQVIDSRTVEPMQKAIMAEDSQRLTVALSELPYKEREVVLLHLRAGMTFKAISRLQDTSVNTVQSRYRYGLKKLRSLLGDEVKE